MVSFSGQTPSVELFSNRTSDNHPSLKPAKAKDTVKDYKPEDLHASKHVIDAGERFHQFVQRPEVDNTITGMEHSASNMG